MIFMLRCTAGAGVQSACVFTGFLGFLFYCYLKLECSGSVKDCPSII